MSVLVFPVVSFLLDFPPISYMHSSSPPFVLHALPISSSLTWWVDNIKIDLREIGWNGGDWIDLAQDRDQWRALVKAVMNFRVP
jgi:hypothetical protein